AVVCLHRPLVVADARQSGLELLELAPGRREAPDLLVAVGEVELRPAPGVERLTPLELRARLLGTTCGDELPALAEETLGLRRLVVGAGAGGEEEDGEGECQRGRAKGCHLRLSKSSG